MASVLVAHLLFFLLSANVGAHQNPSNLINLGSSLSPKTHPNSWLSPSHLFAFGFYPQDNGFAVGIWLVGQQENTIVWTANRDDPPVSSNATIEFTKDGRLLLRTEQGREQLIADVPEVAVSASMLDSGNFVLQNDSYVIWKSFDFPTDTILGGQNLTANGYLWASHNQSSDPYKLVSSASSSDHSSGRFKLTIMGLRVAAYHVNGYTENDDAYWSSAEAYAPGHFVEVSLNLNQRGRLYLDYHISMITLPLVNSSAPGRENNTIIYRATLDVDGIFRLYSHRFESNTSSIVTIIWSALQDGCEVHGICGFNSYCSSMGTNNKADCNCYPGFVFADPSNKLMGCYRNFSEDLCRSRKDPVMLYNITTMENIEWGDYPYSVVSSMDKKDCGKACLEDCNCGGSLYFINGFCKKYKLPLRYGKRNSSTTATAFFKMISLGNAEISDHNPPDHRISPIVVTERKGKLILILAVSLGSVACLCLFIAIASFIAYTSRISRYRKLPVPDDVNLGPTEEFTLRSFSYEELEKATDSFKEELGKGSYGAVYKGTLSGGNRTVAVKRLEKVLEEGERKFRSEMTAIGRTHHRNLVRLLGFCVEGSKKLLVYDYMSNGSLADLLFKTETHPCWRERVKIILDVGRGIIYLHEECEAHIIHGDIKPKNILMDDSWTAKISDFGLAKLLLANQIGTITGITGTREYSAPEWHKNALISVKSDIYSFGVVLLEIVCCRSNIEVNVSTADEISLSTWVYKCFVSGELYKLVKDEEVDFMMLERVVKVGLWCIQDDPDLRPCMKNIILMLEGRISIFAPPSPAP